MQNHLDPARFSNVASMQGKGYASFCVTFFRARKSTQNLQVPSFFLTRQTGADKDYRLVRSSFALTFCLFHVQQCFQQCLFVRIDHLVRQIAWYSVKKLNKLVRSESVNFSDALSTRLFKCLGNVMLEVLWFEFVCT